MTTAPKKTVQSVASNRKAFRDYTVVERIEAGIELLGTEVKSVRSGEVNLTGSFARVENGEVILYNLHIAPYEQGNRFNHDPIRARRLLLRSGQIRKLFGQTSQKGYALVPLKVYFKGRYAKVEIGVCKGKLARDKRETIRRRSAEREAQRAARRK